MQVERALQVDHSEYMRVVASFIDEAAAEKVHRELVRHLEALFARTERFTCAAFGRSFPSEEEFAKWKREEWDPIADEPCKLEVERKPDGSVHVWGDYGLVLDDWGKDEVGIALEGTVVALHTYTAGYGIEHLADWLENRGGKVDVQVEGEEYGYVPLEMALEEIQAAADAPGPGGLRAEDGHCDSAQPAGDGEVSGPTDPV